MLMEEILSPTTFITEWTSKIEECKYFLKEEKKKAKEQHEKVHVK